MVRDCPKNLLVESPTFGPNRVEMKNKIFSSVLGVSVMSFCGLIPCVAVADDLVKAIKTAVRRD